MEKSYDRLREAVIQVSQEEGNENVYLSMGSHGDLITLLGFKKGETDPKIYHKYFQEDYFEEDSNGLSSAIEETRGLALMIRVI